jgi:phosphate transport system substrate-binding protein
MHNLPGKKTLQLSADTIAKIFSGKITMWNDEQIVADNNRTIATVVYSKNPDGTLKKDSKGDPIVLKSRNVKRNYVLPPKKIQVVVRSDGSGTTENFTNFLNKSAPSVWTRAKASVFKDSFPGDINAPGNLGRIVGASSSTGVGLQASKTPYSITYNEVNYAKTYKLKVADVINPAGTAVAPDATGTSAFLASATQDANGYLTFDYATKEKGAYTLGIVSYMLVDTNYPDKEKAKAVKQLAEFILSPKCALDAGEDLGFALITGDFLKKSLAQVAKIK